MLSDHVIRTVNFNPEGSIAIEYVTTTEDVKRNGIVRNHVLFIPPDPEYADEIEDVYEAAIELLEDVLEDMPRLEASGAAVVPDNSNDDDDEDD